MLKTQIKDLNDYEIELTFDLDEENPQARDTIVKALAEMSGVRSTKELWNSKYNPIIVYDYEPFITTGFLKIVTYTFLDKEHKDFFCYELHRIANTIQELNNMLEQDVTKLETRKAIRGTKYEREEFKIKV